MNKLLKIFHWCLRKEQQMLSYLDKKEYVLDFIEELVYDTETDIDDIFYYFVKKRLDQIDLKE